MDDFSIVPVRPGFKELYGDFGGYLLSKLQSGSPITVEDCTAQIRKNGFASAARLLKDTAQKKILATALHVPDGKGGIRHYDVRLYCYKRDKPSDPHDWRLVSDFPIYGTEIEPLQDFLASQNHLIGKSFQDKYATVIYSGQEIPQQKVADIQELITRLTSDQIEEILNSPTALAAVNKSLPRLRVDLLERLIAELGELLKEGEEDVQRWLDADPKLRCLIFGLEYIDFKRETRFGNSQFDVLVDISGTEHVIIELKSPNKPLFSIKERATKHGVKRDYILSPDLAEAIPQAIKYFRVYEDEGEETFIRNGTTQRKVPKAIIVLGRNEREDPLWQEHYADLRNRIAGIEILTYDHLIEKMENQIANLRKLSTEVQDEVPPEPETTEEIDVFDIPF